MFGFPCLRFFQISNENIDYINNTELNYLE